MIKVDIQVNQSIQTARHNVPLVHGKATLIRVFMNSDSPENSETLNDGYVTGTLLVKWVEGKADNSEPIALQPVNSLKVSKYAFVSNPNDLDSTLNFVIDPEDWQKLAFKQSSNTARLEFSIEKLRLLGDEKALKNLQISSGSVQVNRPIKMRLRAIAYRFNDPETGEVLEPAGSAIDEVKNYVESAFPVSELEWSWNIVEAPESFINLRGVFDENERAEEQIDINYQVLFQHLLALRTTEINSDDANDAVGSNTIYIGLISDPTHRLGGASMDSPDFPTAQVVACCEATQDGELAAHEIAHMLGCEHPGIPNKATHGRFLGQTDQESDDSIGPVGEILTNNFQGYGVRFFKGSKLPRLIDPDRYYDLMTYRSPKWVSPISYTNMLERLDDIYNNEINLPVRSDAGYFTVIGAYNLLNRDATVQFVLPAKQTVYPLLSNADEPVKNPDPGLMSLVRETDSNNASANNANGDEENSNEFESQSPIYIRSNPERTDANISIGIFQHSVANAPKNHTRHRLTIRGQPVEIVDLTSIGDLLKAGIENDPIYQHFKSTAESTESPDLSNIDLSFIDRVVENLSQQNSLITSMSANENFFKFRYDVKKACLHLKYDWRKFFEIGADNEIQREEFFRQFSLPLTFGKGEFDASSVSALKSVLDKAIINYRRDLLTKSGIGDVKGLTGLKGQDRFPFGKQINNFEQRNIAQQAQLQEQKSEPDTNLRQDQNKVQSKDQPLADRVGEDADDQVDEQEIASLKLFLATLELLETNYTLGLTWITSFFALAKVPITTIVQVKHQSSSGTDKGEWDINNYVRTTSENGQYQYKLADKLDRWETIYISTRLANNDIWIPDRYLQSSLSHYSGNTGQAGIPKFQSNDSNEYDALFSMTYRVRLAIGGFSVTMFDNSEANVSGELLASVADRFGGHRFDSGQAQEVLNRPAANRYDAQVDFHPILSDQNS